MHVDVEQKIQELAQAEFNLRNVDRAMSSRFFKELPFEERSRIEAAHVLALSRRETAIYLLLVAAGHAQDMQDRLDSYIAKAAEKAGKQAATEARAAVAKLEKLGHG